MESKENFLIRRLSPMIRKVILSIILTSINVGSLWASAWAQEPGGYFFKMSFNYMLTGQEFNHKGEKIFIKDQTGKMWDVTHAVQNYGFDPAVFSHGLGPNAIPPIQNPQMLRPGDTGYPNQNEDIVVLGANLSGDSRAYPLSVMIRHEIANEKFGSTYVSVAY
jgi:hypothetical protein